MGKAYLNIYVSQILAQMQFFIKTIRFFHGVRPVRNGAWAKASRLYGDQNHSNFPHSVHMGFVSQVIRFWLIGLIFLDHLGTLKHVRNCQDLSKSSQKFRMRSTCNILQHVPKLLNLNLLICGAMITNDALLASVKLLASDLDGTLLNPDHVPAARMRLQNTK